MPRQRLPRSTSHLFRSAERYIRRDKRKRLYQLLARRPELQSHFGDGHPLLHLAVWRRRYEIVKWMLQHGADPDLAETGNNTPLIHAASENDLRMVRLLLDYGAAIDKPNGELETPLGFAYSYEAVDSVRLLCERGADVNGTEGWGHSYLWAVQCKIQNRSRSGSTVELERTVEIEQILLAHGARVIHEEPKLPFDLK